MGSTCNRYCRNLICIATAWPELLPDRYRYLTVLFGKLFNKHITSPASSASKHFVIFILEQTNQKTRLNCENRS